MSMNDAIASTPNGFAVLVYVATTFNSVSIGVIMFVVNKILGGSPMRVLNIGILVKLSVKMLRSILRSRATEYQPVLAAAQSEARIMTT